MFILFYTSREIFLFYTSREIFISYEDGLCCIAAEGVKFKHRLSPFESELYDTIHGIRQFGPKMGLAPVVSN